MFKRRICYFILFLLSFSLILLFENFVLAQKQPKIVLVGQVIFLSEQVEKNTTITILINNVIETTTSDKTTGFFRKNLYNTKEGNNFIKIYAEKDGIKGPEEIISVYFVPDVMTTITVSNIVLKIPNSSPEEQKELIPIQARCKKDPDFNGDGEINLMDFSIMLYFWESTEYCQADLDGDGIIGLSDVSILLFIWNR